MDIQQLISELGMPIAVSLAMMWGCFYLIKYITGQHTMLMIQKFQSLMDIHIKLIDQQKQIQLKVEGWASNTETLVRLFIEEKDKEKERLLNKLKKNNGYK
tara:strand:+ start:605 stop:907 length:303 start_codon:yes stop_codon:yes gene_type:complete